MLELQASMGKLLRKKQTMSSAVPTLKVVSGLEMSMLLARHPPQQPTLAAVVFVSWLLCCCVLSFFSAWSFAAKKHESEETSCPVGQ